MTGLSAGIATATYTVAMVVLLGWRSVQHRRSTGTSGFNGFRGMGADRAARAAGPVFAVAVVIGLVAPLLAWTGVIETVQTATVTRLLAGLLLAVAGLVLGVVSQAAMGPSWRIGVDPAEQTALVTGGVFAVVRNPIFTALVMIQAGTTLMALSWLSILGTVLLVAACQLQVRRVEEPYLRRVHGAAYTRYAARTGRFLPGLGRNVSTGPATGDVR